MQELFLVVIEVTGKQLVDLVDTEALPKGGDRYTIIAYIDDFQLRVFAFAFDVNGAFLLHQLLGILSRNDPLDVPFLRNTLQLQIHITHCVGVECDANVHFRMRRHDALPEVQVKGIPNQVRNFLVKLLSLRGHLWLGRAESDDAVLQHFCLLHVQLHEKSAIANVL